MRSLGRNAPALSGAEVPTTAQGTASASISFLTELSQKDEPSAQLPQPSFFLFINKPFVERPCLLSSLLVAGKKCLRDTLLGDLGGSPSGTNTATKPKLANLRQYCRFPPGSAEL